MAEKEEEKKKGVWEQIERQVKRNRESWIMYVVHIQMDPYHLLFEGHCHDLMIPFGYLVVQINEENLKQNIWKEKKITFFYFVYINN